MVMAPSAYDLRSSFKRNYSSQGTELWPNSEQTLRVVSFNIHKGTDVHCCEALQSQMKAVLALKPDVVALQEAPISNQTRGYLQAAGLSHILEITAFGCYGNVLASRFPWHKAKTVRLPGNGESRYVVVGSLRAENDGGWGPGLTLACTHLDVWDETERTRNEQVRALDGLLHQENCLLVGDFNALHKPDYSTRRWAEICQHDDTRGVRTQFSAMENLIDGCGFADVFATNGRCPPDVSCWSGRRVDYALASPNAHGWDVSDAKVIRTACSDHLPIGVDLVA